MKMQAHAATRSTTATRRADRKASDLARMVHVSQGYIPHQIKDELGVESTVYVPMFRAPDGRAQGRTYYAGKKYMKKLRRNMRRLTVGGMPLDRIPAEA